MPWGPRAPSPDHSGVFLLSVPSLWPLPPGQPQSARAAGQPGAADQLPPVAHATGLLPARGAAPAAHGGQRPQKPRARLGGETPLPRPWSVPALLLQSGWTTSSSFPFSPELSHWGPGLQLRAFFSCMAWRAIPGPLSKRKRILLSHQWHPTPALLSGKSHGWRSLVGCSP